MRKASFKGAVRNVWMCLETIQKCLQRVCLTQKRLEKHIGKNPKAVQKLSGNGEFSASMPWSHPKWLQTSGFNDFLPFCFQNSLQNDAFMSWDYIFSQTELRFPEKIKQKKGFSLDLHTWFLNAFCKLPITLKQYVMDKIVLNMKRYRIIKV